MLGHLEPGTEQRPGGDGPENDHQRGFDDRQLTLQPGAAGHDVPDGGRLVDPPLTAALEPEVLHGVGDEEFVPVDLRRRERLVEQPSGRPDEDVALLVLDVPRLLPHQHQPGLRRTVAWDDLLRVLPQVAATAVGQSSSKGGQATPRRNPLAGTGELVHPRSRLAALLEDRVGAVAERFERRVAAAAQGDGGAFRSDQLSVFVA
jgi:hypothetical protein